MMLNNRRFYINVWDGCNLACSHCFNDGGCVAGRVLELGEVLGVIDEARESFGIREVQLTGGEPTLRGDIFDLMTSLLDRGLDILLQTNGQFGDDFVGRLLEFPGERVRLIISLDGLETNSYFRGEDATGLILENIKKLYKRFSLRLNVLLTSRIEWSEIESLVELAKQYDLTLAFNPVCPSGRADVGLLMEPGRYFEYMYRLEEYRLEGVRIRKCFNIRDGLLVENEDCGVRKGRAIHISADGGASPCGFLANLKSVRLGNARENDLHEMITSIPPEVRALPDECRECKFNKTGHCNGGCPARIYALNGTFNAVDHYCIKKDAPNLSK